MTAPATYVGVEKRALALSPVWLVGAVLVAAALATQIRLGMMADVAWLIHCDEMWLDGATPYRDFIEINPPASLLLYIPAVAAARALGLPSETLVSAFGFLSAATAFALSAWILRRGPRVGASVALAAIVALVVLPGETFCERDHLAAVFGIPLLALALARAERTPVPLLAALAAGVGAGGMAAIKPPYALVGVLLALYLGWRIGWRVVLKAPEYWSAAAVGLAYVASVRPFFPVYVADIMPVGVSIYVPSREGWAALVASPGAMLFLMISATAALAARRGGSSPGFVFALLAAAGAAAGYFVQGKGWVYQAVPAAMFATLAGGFALRGQERRALALAAGGLAAAVAAPGLHNLGAAWAIGFAVALAVDFFLDRALEFDLPRLAPLALASAVGVACGVCTIERPPTPDLERTLARMGPGLKLASISEDMGLAFPLARRIGADWVMRRHSLFVTSDVRRLSGQHEGSRRLDAYADAERAEVVADIAANRPDAILVGPTGTDLHNEVWADPRVQAVMGDYAAVAEERRPGYTTQLWVRKGFAPRD